MMYSKEKVTTWRFISFTNSSTVKRIINIKMFLFWVSISFWWVTSSEASIPLTVLSLLFLNYLTLCVTLGHSLVESFHQLFTSGASLMVLFIALNGIQLWANCHVVCLMPFSSLFGLLNDSTKGQFVKSFKLDRRGLLANYLNGTSHQVVKSSSPD